LRKENFDDYTENNEEFNELTQHAITLNSMGYALVCIGPIREAPVICFTDVRFPEEVIYLRNQNGGTMLYVSRPSLGNVTTKAAATHSSEYSLDPADGWVDERIVNDVTLLQLEQRVEKCIARLCLAKGVFRAEAGEFSFPSHV